MKKRPVVRSKAEDRELRRRLKAYRLSKPSRAITFEKLPELEIKAQREMAEVMDRLGLSQGEG